MAPWCFRRGSPDQISMSDFSRLHRFKEVAEIQALVRTFGWDLVYTQLAPGRLQVEAYETRIGDCLLFRERIDCPLVAYGTSTRAGFDVMWAREGSGRVFGDTFLGRQLVLFPPGCAIDVVAVPGARTSHVQVPVERLVAAAAGCDVELVRSPRALVVEPGVDRLRRFQSALERSTGILDRGDLAAWEEIEGDLLLTLVALFDRSAHPATRADGPNGASAAVAMAARRHLQVDLEELDAPAVAASLGISRRHLDRCFKAHYGVSILEFARFRRLHRAREVLLDPAARVSVTEAAYSCGFKHLGRFARQYRDLFGESPRETLRPTTRGALGQTAQRERSDSPSR